MHIVTYEHLCVLYYELVPRLSPHKQSVHAIVDRMFNKKELKENKLSAIDVHVLTKIFWLSWSSITTTTLNMLFIHQTMSELKLYTGFIC